MVSSSKSIKKELFALFSATLASSCCWIQLLLNALKFGCAGFSILTPYRPLFLALTCISAILTVRRKSWIRSAIFLAVVFGIALMDQVISLPSSREIQMNETGLVCKQFTVTNVFCAGCFSVASELASKYAQEKMIERRWNENTHEAIFRIGMEDRTSYQEFKEIFEEMSRKKGKTDFKVTKLEECN